MTTKPELYAARKWRDGESCNHQGCLSHISHPCEGCGRIGGRYPQPEAMSAEREVELPDLDVTQEDHDKTIAYYEDNDGGYRACDISHGEFAAKRETFSLKRHLKAALRDKRAAEQKRDEAIEGVRAVHGGTIGTKRDDWHNMPFDVLCAWNSLQTALAATEQERDEWKEKAERQYEENVNRIHLQAVAENALAAANQRADDAFNAMPKPLVSDDDLSRIIEEVNDFNWVHEVVDSLRELQQWRKWTSERPTGKAGE